MGSPTWTDAEVDALKYEDFRRLFIEQGLNGHGRRGQVNRLKSMPRLHRTFEASKQALFQKDCKRVLRNINDPSAYSALINGMPGAARSDFGDTVASGPLRTYILLMQVAYSFMRGDEYDYYRLPGWLRTVWSKREFEEAMQLAM